MKVYVGGITWRNYEAEHVYSLFRLLQYAGVSFQPRVGDALIERARSSVATKFLLESDAEVLFTVDSDIVFEPSDALLLCRQAIDQQGIVGAAYVTRSRTDCKISSLPELGVPVEFANNPTPVPFRWVSSGFTAIHRTVLERLAQDLPLCNPKESWRLYPFYLPFIVKNEDGLPILLPEDWALCERARQAGFGVFVNPAIRVKHIGTMFYQLEDMVAPAPTTMPIRITRTVGTRYQVEYPDREFLDSVTTTSSNNGEASTVIEALTGQIS